MQLHTHGPHGSKKPPATNWRLFHYSGHSAAFTARSGPEKLANGILGR